MGNLQLSFKKNLKANKSLFESYDVNQSVFSKPILENPRNNMVKINPIKKLEEKINTSDLFIILIDNF